MIGQKALLEKLDKYTAATFPKASLFIGPSGCGKHTLCKELATRFILPVEDLTDITAEQLIDLQVCPVNKIYTINLSNYTEKQQNQFLKFIEEPPKTAKIILFADTEAGILDTILNRCVKYHFTQYTKKELLEIVPMAVCYPDFAFDVCMTPGQLKGINIASLNALYQECTTLNEFSHLFGAQDFVVINNKVNTKEDYDKYDFDLFFKMMMYTAKSLYMKTLNQMFINKYKFTSMFYQNMANKTVMKEAFLLNYLSKFWQAFGRKD